MKTSKTTFAIAAALSVAATLGLVGNASAQEDATNAIAADKRHYVMQAADLKWSQPAAYAKGAELAIVSGDPTKQGFYVVRLRVPAGFRIAPHQHPNDENVTVLSGTFHVGTGEKFSTQKGTTVKTGGFAHVGKGMAHYAYFPEASVIQLHGMGPQGIVYMNPADDPRKAKP